MSTGFKHRRQFIVTAEKIQCPVDWQQLSVFNEKQTLYYHPDLKVTTYNNSIIQQKYIVVGHIFQTNHALPGIDTILSSANEDEILNYLNQCGGRWVLFTPSEIKMDALGLLGLYYYKPTTQIKAISSSVALLCQIYSLAEPSFKPGRFDRINWRISPGTGISGIYQILNDNFVAVDDSNNFQLITFNPFIKQTYYKEEDISDVILDRLLGEVRSISHQFSNIKVALSSGYDSRLIIALLIHIGVDFESYTQLHPYISWGDRHLPSLLARQINRKHQYYSARKINKETLEAYHSHQGWQVFDADNLFFAKNQWSWFRKDEIALRGGVLNIFRRHDYQRIFFNQEGVLLDFNQNEFPKSVTHHKDDILKWIALQKDNDFINKIKIGLLFHFQQREGSWLSKVEQGLDVLDGISIHLGNSRELLSLSMELDNIHLSKNINYLLVERLNPALLKYPFNPKNPFLYRVYLKLKNYLSFNK